jgi:hypothetical protein
MDVDFRGLGAAFSHPRRRERETRVAVFLEIMAEAIIAGGLVR